MIVQLGVLLQIRVNHLSSRRSAVYHATVQRMYSLYWRPQATWKANASRGNPFLLEVGDKLAALRRFARPVQAFENDERSSLLAFDVARRCYRVAHAESSDGSVESKQRLNVRMVRSNARCGLRQNVEQGGDEGKECFVLLAD